MTAEVVALPTKPRVVVVEAPREDHVRPPDPRALAIEHCADAIEKALNERLTYEQRIGLERALEELVGEIEWRRGRHDPW